MQTSQVGQATEAKPWADVKKRRMDKKVRVGRVSRDFSYDVRGSSSTGLLCLVIGPNHKGAPGVVKKTDVPRFPFLCHSRL